jgi:heme/copper-type cytochrome/quinol oxidase subunit 3
MSPEEARPVGRGSLDVSVLPRSAFGHRALTWWATAGFMLVEGTTLTVVATSYLYLRMNAAEWPPRPASAPELLVPTINLVVILATMWPMWQATRAAKRFDIARTRRWVTIGALFSLVATVLRFAEFQSLNVRWDSNAYGSAVWAVVFAHTTLLVTDVLETGTIAAIFYTRRLEPKHFSDVEDAGLYQYFLSLSWLVLYLLVILGPRVL